MPTYADALTPSSVLSELRARLHPSADSLAQAGRHAPIPSPVTSLAPSFTVDPLELGRWRKFAAFGCLGNNKHTGGLPTTLARTPQMAMDRARRLHACIRWIDRCQRDGLLESAGWRAPGCRVPWPTRGYSAALSTVKCLLPNSDSATASARTAISTYHQNSIGLGASASPPEIAVCCP